jgi:hypothetical protein
MIIKINVNIKVQKIGFNSVAVFLYMDTQHNEISPLKSFNMIIQT